MSEQELREALREYAGPLDPPAGGRDEILARVAAHKRRFRVSAGVAAAAAVATVVAGGLMLRPDGGSTRPQPLDGWHPERTSTAPYDAKGCPDRLPLPGQVNTRLPDLAQVRSVRFCSDTRSSLAGEPVALDQDGALDPEALVEDLPGFAQRIAALEPADPARCAAISVLPTADALAFTLADGATVLVPATMCTDIERGEAKVDGQRLREAFLTALHAQREQVGYERDLAMPAGCDPRGMAGPLRPGRETFSGGRVCTPGQDQQDLSRPALDRLNAAWADADAESGSSQPDRCLDLEATHPRLLAWSNRGDLLRLSESPCGFVFVEAHRAGEYWRIPITLDELA